MTALLALSTASLSAEDRIRRLVDAWLSGRNERTRRAYGQDVADFARYLGAPDVDAASRILLSLSPGDANGAVLGYRNHMAGRNLAPATINRRLAALRSLVKLGRTLGAVTWTLEIGNVKSQAYRDTTGPPRPAVARMMDDARGRGDRKGARDFAILRLLYDVALRRFEVVALDLEHLDLEAGRVSILGKGRLEREWLCLPEPTRKALAAWLDVRGLEPGPLFLSLDRARKGPGRLSGEGLYRLVRKAGERIGVRARPHGLRHSAVTAAVQAATAAGISVCEVMSFSRHRSLSVLQVYVDRLANSQGKLAEAVAGGL